MNIRKGLCALAVLAAAALSAGCGGINASPSVSPGSFFLPGLMKNDAPKPAPAPAPAQPTVAAAPSQPNS